MIQPLQPLFSGVYKLFRCHVCTGTPEREGRMNGPQIITLPNGYHFDSYMPRIGLEFKQSHPLIKALTHVFMAPHIAFIAGAKTHPKHWSDDEAIYLLTQDGQDRDRFDAYLARQKAKIKDKFSYRALMPYEEAGIFPKALGEYLSGYAIWDDYSEDFRAALEKLKNKPQDFIMRMRSLRPIPTQIFLFGDDSQLQIKFLPLNFEHFDRAAFVYTIDHHTFLRDKPST